MRPSNKSRSRNKPGNNGNNGNQNNNNNNNGPRRSSMGNIINRVFESAGPDGKVRGTPQQIIDKYQALARDAQVAGDRVAAESYLQYSEHYSRILVEAQRQQAETRFNQEREGDRGGEEGGFDQQRRQPQSQPPVASGLAMIDPEDSYDTGPIETPEGRRGQLDEPTSFRRAPMQSTGHVNGNYAPTPAPLPVPEPAPAPAAVPAPQAEAPAAEPAAPVAAEAVEATLVPAKRPRPRRRKTSADVPTADAPATDAPQADAAAPEQQRPEPVTAPE
jgi:hypothetical protein